MIDPAPRLYGENQADPPTCIVCGNLPDRHTPDQACPHTADSLTDEQIEQWWRDGGRGGSFVDVVHAHDQIRIAVNRGRNANGRPLFAPTPEEIEESRRRIADALNRGRGGEP